MGKKWKLHFGIVGMVVFYFAGILFKKRKLDKKKSEGQRQKRNRRKSRVDQDVFGYTVVPGNFKYKRYKECQDSLEVIKKGPTLIVAMADGIGSCSKGKDGASFATNKCLAILNSFDLSNMEKEEVKERLINTLREVQEKLLTDVGESYPDYGTTITLLVICSNKTYFLRLGDSVLIYEDNNQRFNSIIDMSDYDVNQTDHLFSDIDECAKFYVFDYRFSKVLLSTDGLTDLFIDQYGAVNEDFLVRLFDSAGKNKTTIDMSNALKSFVERLDEIEFSDDKSLFLYTRKKL